MHPILIAVRKFACWLTSRANGRPMVVLGRDGWLIWATLRSLNVPVQYFHWSRNTQPDAAAKVWLNEVPPGAVVMDTGFAGSIINSIRVIDPTISGAFLMSSDGPYQSPPEWLWRYEYAGIRESLIPSHIRDIVLSLEHEPKAHGPCLSYQGDRAVFCQEDTEVVDKEVAGISARLALSALGIDSMPSAGERGYQRLGLSSHGDYREHCLTVRRARRDLERWTPYPELLVEPTARHMQFLGWLKSHPKELHDHIRAYPSMWAGLHYRAGLDQSYHLVGDLVRDLPIA